MQPLQHLTLLGLTLALPLLPCTAGIDDELVFETDPRTHMPLGELVEARGLLLDPRDLPEPLLPYLEAAAGLEGLEASLTALFGRSLGFAAERKHLPKRYAEFCSNPTSTRASRACKPMSRSSAHGCPSRRPRG